MRGSGPEAQITSEPEMSRSILQILLCFGWGFSFTFSINSSNDTDSTKLIREVVCKQDYSMTCLRLDIVGAVERMGGGAEYQLLPGVYFSHHLNKSSPPQNLIEEVSRGNHSKELDTYISSRINQYLSSLTLSVKVLDSITVNHARKISEQILSHLLPAETGVAGRKKGGFGLGGALWAAGSIAAVGLAALAAMSGKALMTSMLALMLAGAGMLRGGGGASSGGGGGCGKETQYIHAVHGRNIEYMDAIHDHERIAHEAEIRPVFRPSEAYTFTQPNIQNPGLQ